MAPASRPKEVSIFRGRNVTITGDARAFPLMITTTDGELDISTFDLYFDWRNSWIEYAVSQRVKLIQISVTNSMSPPNATVRKHLGDRGKNDDKLEGFVGTWVVVPNALLRGMVTAVTWVMGSSSVKTFGSVVEAAEAARKYFAEAGIEAPPFDGSSYTPPTKD